MTKLNLPNISDDKSVTVCGMLNVSELSIKFENLKGYFYNYILVLNDEIIYIGYTSDVYNRLVTHKCYKEFDRIILIEFTNKKSALKMEKNLIQKYEPKFNIQYLKL